MKEKATSRAGRVRLAPGRQLQKKPAPDGHFLAGPAGAVQLNESAAASTDDRFAMDVREFLNAARRHGWIVED